MKITKKMFTPNKRKAGKQASYATSSLRTGHSSAMPVDENQPGPSDLQTSHVARKPVQATVLQPLTDRQKPENRLAAKTGVSVFARNKTRKAVVEDLWQDNPATSPLPQLLEDMTHLLQQRPKLSAPLHTSLVALHARAMQAEERSNQMKSDILRQKLDYGVFLQRSASLAAQQEEISAGFVGIVNQVNDEAAVQRLHSQHDILHTQLARLLATPMPVEAQQAVQQAAQRLHKTAVLTNRLQQDLGAQRLSRPVFLQAQQHLQASMQRQHQSLENLRQRILVVHEQLPAYDALSVLPAYEPAQ